MQPAEIKERVRTIGLTYPRLAILCALDEATIERTLNGRTTPLVTTLDAIMAALAGEEKRVRDALVERHGLPTEAA